MGQCQLCWSGGRWGKEEEAEGGSALTVSGDLRWGRAVGVEQRGDECSVCAAGSTWPRGMGRARLQTGASVPSQCSGDAEGQLLCSLEH